MKYDIELFSIFIYCLDFKQKLLVTFIRILKHIRFPFDIHTLSKISIFTVYSICD
jgi:hypothetical protein